MFTRTSLANMKFLGCLVMGLLLFPVFLFAQEEEDDPIQPGSNPFVMVTHTKGPALSFLSKSLGRLGARDIKRLLAGKTLKRQVSRATGFRKRGLLVRRGEFIRLSLRKGRFHVKRAGKGGQTLWLTNRAGKRGRMRLVTGQVSSRAISGIPVEKQAISGIPVEIKAIGGVPVEMGR